MKYRREFTTNSHEDNLKRDQSLYVSYANVSVCLDASFEIIQSLSSLMNPIFTISNQASSEIVSTFEINKRAYNAPLFETSKPWRMPPILQLYDTEDGAFRILNTEGKKIIFRHKEFDSSECMIEISENCDLWKIETPDFSLNSARTVARLLKYFFGCYLNKRGDILLHASSVQVNGRNFIFYGKKGAGKTSFMFRSCIEAGSYFISDDTTVMRYISGKFCVSGWPKRIGLSLSAVKRDHKFTDFDLRRKSELNTNLEEYIGRHLPPEERRRIEFDVDEFLNKFNIKYAFTLGEPCFINLEFCPDLSRSHEFEPQSELDIDNLLLDSKDMKQFTDYLHLVPVPFAKEDKLCSLKRIQDIPAFKIKYNSQGLGMVRDILSDLDSKLRRG